MAISLIAFKRADLLRDIAHACPGRRNGPRVTELHRLALSKTAQDKIELEQGPRTRANLPRCFWMQPVDGCGASGWNYPQKDRRHGVVQNPYHTRKGATAPR